MRKNLFLLHFLYNRHARVAHKYDSGVNLRIDGSYDSRYCLTVIAHLVSLFSFPPETSMRETRHEETKRDRLERAHQRGYQAGIAGR